MFKYRREIHSIVNSRTGLLKTAKRGMQHYVAYSDGCCRGNGQKGSVSGWGFLVRGANDEPGRGIVEKFGCVQLDRRHPDYLGATSHTNNIAELVAAYRALEHIETVPDIKRFTIYCDSEYVINLLTGKTRASMNKVLVSKVKSKYKEVRKSLHVEFMHVRGHSGDPDNTKADALAKMGAELCR